MWSNMVMLAKPACASAPATKDTIKELYKKLDETKPDSPESKRISEKILEAIFDVGSR